MRLIFAGTPAFAATELRALLKEGHEVALVLTQPDRAAGRGLQVRHSDVKTLALQSGLPIAQPVTLKSAEALDLLRVPDVSVMIVAAYGLILPPAVLNLFPLGCVNIHASLLPRWRGAAPIQRALQAGDSHTGISIMRMEAGLDTGPVLLTEKVEIAAEDTAATLHDKLAEIGARCIVRTLPALERGELTAHPQPEQGITYATKIDKSEAAIDWRKSAAELDRQVRAFNPFPVATTVWRGESLRIWRARALREHTGMPGRVIESSKDSIIVACGNGALSLLELQRASARRLPVSEFLPGSALARGEQLGA